MSWFGSSQSVEPSIDGIEIKTQPEERPSFKREYTVRLDNRAVMEITIYWLYGNTLSKSGTLTQPNGREVYFDPERVADRILDPTLVPLIESRVANIFAIDRAFRSSNLAEFVDETGAKWRHVG